MTPNDDHETGESDDNVPDKVNHQLGLWVVFLEVCEVGEDEGQQQVASGDGNCGRVLLQIAFDRGDGTVYKN